METLEETIKANLIERGTQELLERYEANPYLREMVEETTQKALDIHLLTVKKNFGDEITDEEFEDMKSELYKQYEFAKADPNYIKNQISAAHSMAYMGREGLDEFINAMENDLRANDLSEDDIDLARKVYSELYPYVDKTDQLIGRLVEIANDSGLETALSRETQYEMIREIYPTPQDYRNHIEGMLIESEELNQITAKTFKNGNGEEDNEYGNFMGDIYEGIVKLQKEMREKGEKLREANVNAMIEKIYA